MLWEFPIEWKETKQCKTLKACRPYKHCWVGGGWSEVIFWSYPSYLKVEIESFGYTMADLKYAWNDGKTSVKMSPDVSLPQFIVLGHRYSPSFHLLSNLQPWSSGNVWLKWAWAPGTTPGFSQTFSSPGPWATTWYRQVLLKIEHW